MRRIGRGILAASAPNEDSTNQTNGGQLPAADWGLHDFGGGWAWGTQGSSPGNGTAFCLVCFHCAFAAKALLLPCVFPLCAFAAQGTALCVFTVPSPPRHCFLPCGPQEYSLL